ncbi:MAG: hypothetical protein HY755_10205 [Nitrospirae bacterium]|nr:hypothetical protein [Nitrospirota bacterium]
MLDFIGKTVEVLTIDTTYTGKLVEIGETEVSIESELGWISIPVEKIVSITEKEG